MSIKCNDVKWACAHTFERFVTLTSDVLYQKISPSWRRFPVGVDHLKGDRRLREIDFSFGDRRQIDISSTSTSSITFSWRKQTAGPTVLHDQLWTAFLWVFWSDCLERHAGSTAQLGLISKWLQTIAENRFVPDCFGVVTTRAFVAV